MTLNPASGSPPGLWEDDFDGAGAAAMAAGCEGAREDWEEVRALEDPKDGSARSRGVENETCLLAPEVAFADGAITAKLRAAHAPAGFVLRYRDSGHYLGLYLDIAQGTAMAREWNGEEPTLLGASTFKLSSGAHELTAVLEGARLVVFVDGRRILDVAGARQESGRVGLLAAPLAVGQFDDVSAEASRHGASLLIGPATPAVARLGRLYDLQLRCADLSGEEKPSSCSYTLSGGVLPRGLSLSRSGKVAGIPSAPGESRFTVEARGPGGRAARRRLRLRVEAVQWPRFPFDGAARVEPVLAVHYSTDDIGQNLTSLSRLGHPDRMLFALHKDHPLLRLTLMSCPANRYLGTGSLDESSDAAAVWRRLALDPDFSWLELGGHGYSHSPDGDSNRNHHEFSIAQSGCNVDHTALGALEYCRKRFTLAREIYRKIGIPDERISVMRFPGVEDSPEALRAAAEAGFVMIFGSRHPDEPGREWWISYPGGGEILEIENSSLLRAFARAEDLEAALMQGRIHPEEARAAPELRAAVQRGLGYVERVVAGGGILNLSDHWWETFQEIGGTVPRYLVLDEVLKEIEGRYGPRAWYPRARELAMWLEARRRAEVVWSEQGGEVRVRIEPPPKWRDLKLEGLENASIVIGLPAGWTGVGNVRIKEGDKGPAAWRPLDPSRYWLEPRGLAVIVPLRGPIEIRATSSGGAPPR
jgi:hypothetical protein